MEQYLKLEIHKATLIRKNNNPIQDVYSFNIQTDVSIVGAWKRKLEIGAGRVRHSL